MRKHYAFDCKNCFSQKSCDSYCLITHRTTKKKKYLKDWVCDPARGVGLKSSNMADRLIKYNLSHSPTHTDAMGKTFV